MTIYSQHRNRGKVQILATYRSPTGVASTTVTSVDDAILAAPIVDALNRISACATAPISVHGTRNDTFDHYPSEHLAALTDRSARPGLLEGAHSLWYEHIKAVLHDALTWLDDSMALVPAPIRTALDAEVEAEARGLRDALADYHEGVGLPEGSNRRAWNFEAPFISYEDMNGLVGEGRLLLDRVELGITDEQLREGAADLRVLLDACTRCDNDEATLAVDDFSITDDPRWLEPNGYFLSVEAPMPNGAYRRNDWRVDICRWVSDDPGDEESDAVGTPVLRCTRATRPSAADIVELLNRSGGNAEQLIEWAKTPVGETLANTAFVVTSRYDD